MKRRERETRGKEEDEEWSLGDGFEVEAVLVYKEETVAPEIEPGVAIQNEEEDACFDS